MNYTIKSVCISHVGNYRSINQDNLYTAGKILRLPNDGTKPIINVASSYKRRVYAVFDGMGGEALGERAALVAAEELKRSVPSLVRASDPADGLLCELCEDMNVSVSDETQLNGGRIMGTTVALGLFEGDTFYSCNVGDSPVFLFRDRQLTCLSVEHNEKLINPDLANADNGKKRRKYALIQFLGIASEGVIVEPEIKSLRVCNGDRFLICSDGLTDMLTTEQIASVLNEEADLEACASRLLDCALKAGGLDNTTLIVCEATEELGNVLQDWYNRTLVLCKIRFNQCKAFFARIFKKN